MLFRSGETEKDWYGRETPKKAHGSENVGEKTVSGRQIMAAAMRLYDRIVNSRLLVRRMYVVANHTEDAEKAKAEPEAEQMDMFALLEGKTDRREEEAQEQEKEQRLQQSLLGIREKFGKNAVLHGTSYQADATGRERNRQIGGHKA